MGLTHVYIVGATFARHAGLPRGPNFATDSALSVRRKNPGRRGSIPLPTAEADEKVEQAPLLGQPFALRAGPHPHQTTQRSDRLTPAT